MTARVQSFAFPTVCALEEISNLRIMKLIFTLYLSQFFSVMIPFFLNPLSHHSIRTLYDVKNLSVGTKWSFERAFLFCFLNLISTIEKRKMGILYIIKTKKKVATSIETIIQTITKTVIISVFIMDLKNTINWPLKNGLLEFRRRE